MEVVSYFDTSRNRKREFRRLRICRDGNMYVLEALICKTFSDETVCEEIDRGEFGTEKEARAEYEKWIREI